MDLFQMKAEGSFVKRLIVRLNMNTENGFGT
jgi:hypothetical protein